ncbi:hypothetical protein FEM48_Zijuj01G0256900 [Ziziphus jujuba var. spinosa]|uniref:Pectinesterase inhibitor domain-containing protein n=1 Tax=Ziziphus jujuba var. spinosa TaxID=714518 RepID=A0A978W4T0_ZIZJJ|nr:hypothetical protein FEM48_Zijuj01G0256900 [Ziziphus jujuba var. spinosa]
MVLFRLLGLSLFIFFCCASAAKQTVLAKEVCKKTSNYTFCVESLYADPRTPKANRQTLAYITFGLAYLNASKTQKLIAELLESQLLQFLKRCKNDYDKAVSKLEGAYNDLNSETYFELANDANEASGYAKDCEAAINGRRSSLTPRNRHLKGLCEICVVVAKLFTGNHGKVESKLRFGSPIKTTEQQPDTLGSEAEVSTRVVRRAKGPRISRIKLREILWKVFSILLFNCYNLANDRSWCVGDEMTNGVYGDLNSETYFGLADDANEASGYAKDCQAANNGTYYSLES